MLTSTQAREFAQRWLQGVGSHDVNQMVSFYTPDAQLESPAVVKLLGEPSGRIQGHERLRAFFSKALTTYPHMNMQLIEASIGISSITVWYANHRGTRTSACLELDAAGKIRRNLTHYSEWKP